MSSPSASALPPSITLWLKSAILFSDKIFLRFSSYFPFAPQTLKININKIKRESRMKTRWNLWKSDCGRGGRWKTRREDERERGDETGGEGRKEKENEDQSRRYSLLGKLEKLECAPGSTPLSNLDLSHVNHETAALVFSLFFISTLLLSPSIPLYPSSSSSTTPTSSHSQLVLLLPHEQSKVFPPRIFWEKVNSFIFQASNVLGRQRR